LHSKFKALADETRLRILALLVNGELCVCDLMAILDLPQSTVSRHLATLRNAGWVEDRRQGVWMYYRLSQDNEPLAETLVPRPLPHPVDLRRHGVGVGARLARKGRLIAVNRPRRQGFHQPLSRSAPPTSPSPSA
jgi:DNA-binding transcriptional ArsR family regulator